RNLTSVSFAAPQIGPHFRPMLAARIAIFQRKMPSVLLVLAGLRRPASHIVARQIFVENPRKKPLSSPYFKKIRRYDTSFTREGLYVQSMPHPPSRGCGVGVKYLRQDVGLLGKEEA